MLYRNYSRKEGEWIPNKHGGAENLEAVEFLQSVNHLVHDKFPGVFTIAEESTAWPLVSRPTSSGGLGFTYKWNMGWMHDTLTYFSKDPVYRKYHQGQITFGLWYAFTENFILVLSHDEVVHGKRSILEKMPGNQWCKFANVRALICFMYGHPGKKLMFQGTEFGMVNEWYEKRSIDWHLLDQGDAAYHHHGLMRMVADCNRLYRHEPALWERDFGNEGFSWIDFRDYDSSIVSFFRTGKEWHNILVYICNFTPTVREYYKVGVPHGGYYQQVFNTDSKDYGGAGYCAIPGATAVPEPWQDQPHSITLTLPPLSVLVFKWKQ
jgi:1,4-alpha-glucan branching enzyme